MKKEDFLEFVKVNLAPQLKAGDVVIMDNLNSHHRPEVKEMIEAVGATVEYSLYLKRLVRQTQMITKLLVGGHCSPYSPLYLLSEVRAVSASVFTRL